MWHDNETAIGAGARKRIVEGNPLIGPNSTSRNPDVSTGGGVRTVGGILSNQPSGGSGHPGVPLAKRNKDRKKKFARRNIVADDQIIGCR